MDEHYICQRAANAIISEIGPFRVSTDALQTINQFLDEFIVLLIGCSLSLDLSDIKGTVFNLLPSTLGKNAIVEAELEVKTFTETESIDYELYERMRMIEKDKFPVDEAVVLLKEKCFEYCTLADKDDQLYLQKSIQKRNNSTSESIIISPIIAIYVTTIMEHIAEYLLTAVALSAEHEETDYARVKEVYLALVDDVQLGSVFSTMNLKERMERRLGLISKTGGVSHLSTNNNNNYNNHRKSIHSTITNNNNNSDKENGSLLAINIEEDFDFDFFDENLKNQNLSSVSLSSRPHSNISLHPNNNRKSTYHVLKNNRNSFNNFDGTEYVSSPSSTYDPDNVPTMNFDDLVRSGGTVKVSLTPNRLKSIEVKDPNKEVISSELTWERRSISASRASTPLSHKVSKKSIITNSDSRSKEAATETPRAPKPPVLPSIKKNEVAQFENPKEAPKPPKETPLKKQTPQLPQYSNVSSIPSTTSSDSISSNNSTVPSVESPPVVPPLIFEEKKEAQPTTIDVQENIIPKATKPIILPNDGKMLRRSSISSKKSRENLRRMKSLEGMQPGEDQTPELPDIKHKEKPVEEKPDIEVPSCMVAKRASKADRRRSLHEAFAAEKHGDGGGHRGSVSTSIKQWDDILKSEESSSIPPASHRRSLLRQMRQQQLKEMQQEKEIGMSSNAVLNKVLQFERVSEDVSQNRVSSLPRRERFLYLQQDPSAIERKSTVITKTRPKGIDQSTQTDSGKKEKEEGLVDGDEEWFLQDDEWDEQEELSIVEWLLCE